MTTFIELIFERYWNQLLIVGGIIYYFIKSKRELNHRKNEINHDIFQNARIKAHQNFIKVYSAADDKFMTITLELLFEKECNIISNEINELEDILKQLKLKSLLVSSLLKKEESIYYTGICNLMITFYSEGIDKINNNKLAIDDKKKEYRIEFQKIRDKNESYLRKIILKIQSYY